MALINTIPTDPRLSRQQVNMQAGEGLLCNKNSSWMLVIILIATTREKNHHAKVPLQIQRCLLFLWKADVTSGGTQGLFMVLYIGVTPGGNWETCGAND